MDNTDVSIKGGNIGEKRHIFSNGIRKLRNLNTIKAIKKLKNINYVHNDNDKQPTNNNIDVVENDDEDTTIEYETPIYPLKPNNYDEYNNVKQQNNNVDWVEDHENLLISWAEKASGYAWMHNKSVSLNKKYNMYISVPASIFGYLAGTTTLLIDNENPWTRAFVGVAGILSGILSNFQQMFTFKELSEQHRISCLRFLVFFRDISSELSMSTQHRTDPIDYIMMKRTEMDIMLEQSPPIPERVVKLFNEKTQNIPVNFHKPEVANILQTIVPFGSIRKNTVIPMNIEIQARKIRNEKTGYNGYSSDEYMSNDNNFLTDEKRIMQLKKLKYYRDKEKEKKSTKKTINYNEYHLLNKYFSQWSGYYRLKLIKKHKYNENIKQNKYKDDNKQLHVEVANSHIDDSDMRSYVTKKSMKSIKTNGSNNYNGVMEMEARNSRHTEDLLDDNDYISENSSSLNTPGNKSSIDKICENIDMIKNINTPFNFKNVKIDN